MALLQAARPEPTAELSFSHFECRSTLDEPELHLGNDVIVPDLAGWRRERLPTLPDDAWFSLVPDWACEVLSPSTADTDRQIKMPIYAARGLEWLWLVDPVEKTLEVYRSSEGTWPPETR